MTPAPETQTITDLADLCVAPLPVPIFGTRFWVPGRPPLAWDFTFQELERKVIDEQGSQESIDQLREHIVDLFAIREPDRRQEVDEALGQLDLVALLRAVRTIYSDEFVPAPDDDEAGAVPPPRRRTSAKAAGTKTTTPRKRPPSRSRSSR